MSTERTHVATTVPSWLRPTWRDVYKRQGVDAVRNALPDAAPVVILAALAALWAGALVWVIRREVADRRAAPVRTEVRVPEKV